MMSRWLTGCVLLVVVVLGRAQDEPSTPPAKKATKGEQAFKALLDELQEKLRKTRAQEDRREIFDSYTEKFFELAKEHPADPGAVSALVVVIEMNSRGESKARKTALEKLKKDYANDQLIRPALRPLARMDGDEDCMGLVKHVYADGPDRRTRVEAVRAMVSSLDSDIRRATKIRANPKFRAAWEKSRGDEWVRKFLAGNDSKRRQFKEYEQLLKTK